MTDHPSRYEIWKMFDNLSPNYDRINHIMTYGFDRYWRKQMAKLLPPLERIHLLDIATGTGDQIISLMTHSKRIDRVIGTDLARQMLHIAALKIASKPYADKITLLEADALNLPFNDHSFECVTISFGIRNVMDAELSLKEMVRVLKKGGRALILEGTIPKNFFFRTPYLFYLRYLLPHIGGYLSKNREAYRYLNKTIETFPSGQNFCNLMLKAGFQRVVAHPLTAGSVTIYQGDKH